MENYVIGPRHVFLGNPETANGADMTYLGLTRGNVTVTIGLNMAYARADQHGRTPLADAAYITGLTPVVNCPLVDEDKAKLAKIIVGSTVHTNAGKTAIGLGSGFRKVGASEIGTLALIPQAEIDVGTNGVEAPNGLWLPAVLANDFGQLVYNLPEGDDSLNPRDTQFMGLRRLHKFDGLTATNIPEDMQTIFIGPPAGDTALTGWSLPAVA